MSHTRAIACPPLPWRTLFWDLRMQLWHEAQSRLGAPLPHITHLLPPARGSSRTSRTASLGVDRARPHFRDKDVEEVTR